MALLDKSTLEKIMNDCRDRYDFLKRIGWSDKLIILGIVHNLRRRSR